MCHGFFSFALSPQKVCELPEGFPGGTPEGAEILVEKLPGALARRFPDGSHPNLVMADRGNGFYHSSSGKIVPLYKAALDAAGLRPAMGENAKVQSGTLGDVLLHETAVAWLRRLLEQTTPAVAWKESRVEYFKRLKAQWERTHCFGQGPHTSARIASAQPNVFFSRIGPPHTSERERAKQNAKSRHSNGSSTTRACL